MPVLTAIDPKQLRWSRRRARDATPWYLSPMAATTQIPRRREAGVPMLGRLRRLPRAIALPSLALWQVPIALALALACLAAGVTLPILDVNRFFVFHRPFSILDGIDALMADGEWLVATIIAVFSLGVPLLKIGVLVGFWWRLRRGRRVSPRAFGWLASLGKWSMLDVFVIALLVLSLKAHAFAEAATAPAVYPFLAAIFLTAYAARAVERASRPSPAGAAAGDI
jgi:paraquat-inducible protein A